MKKLTLWLGVGLWLIVGAKTGLAADTETGLKISWSKNMLTLKGGSIPGDSLEVWYLEAVCRSGSTHRDWRQTVIPHKTELLSADESGHRLRLKTVVEPKVELLHEIVASKDEISFEVEAVNHGDEFVDVQWFQPCMRVGGFTGFGQSNYHGRCFIFTSNGLTMLDQIDRVEEAIYRGGQVYVPSGINTNDVNPRPLSAFKPVNGLIGAVSADQRKLVAMAWSDTQELFQGVIVCVHNDPRLGGLKPGERKHLKGKIYVMTNSPTALLKRYQKDFSR
jgi:hypothetical protein